MAAAFQLPAASLPWLLRHELRLAARMMGAKARLRTILTLLLLASVPVVLGCMIAWQLRGAPTVPSPQLRATLLGAQGGMLVLMISLAAVQVLRAFRERDDLDLLLSAPIPPERVVIAKALGVCWTVSLTFLVLFGPFLLASVALGHWQWAGGFLIIFTNAVMATSLAFVIIGLLLQWLGPRRTRQAVHVGGVLTGAAAFVGPQLGMSRSLASKAPGGFAPVLPEPLDWLSHAMVGAPGPLLLLLLFAGAMGWAAARFGARRMLARTTEAVPQGRAGRRPHRFRSGLMRILVTKELRLLARDPELISQVLLRLIYVVPLLLFARDSGSTTIVAAAQLAAGAAAVAGMTAASLAWLIICAEDAPELLDAAPVAASQVLRAKLVAACGPPLLLVLPFVVLAAMQSLAIGVLALLASVLAALSAALVQAWYAQPVARAVFRKRGNGSLAMGVMEVLLAVSWASGAALLARGSLFAAVPLLVAVLLWGGAWATRPRRAGLVATRA